MYTEKLAGYSGRCVVQDMKSSCEWLAVLLAAVFAEIYTNTKFRQTPQTVFEQF